MHKNIKEIYSLYLQNTEICTDTRKVIKGSIFFALKGDNFNANEFALKALENGCSFAVIDEKKYYCNNRFILVDDVLQTLQDLAAFHRRQLKIPVIGITGTNGKTTTKELINAVLKKKFRVQSTQGNLNNHIGVPLTLLSVKNNSETAVVEMGANHTGEISELCKIASPGYGIITNIGKAHLEGFGSLEGIINTKKELFDSVRATGGKVFVSADNSLLMGLSEGTDRVIYGTFPNSDCRGEIIECNPLLRLKWHCKSQNRDIDISTNLFGFFNFENVLASVCIGEYFGVSPEDIKSAIETYIPSNNRSQIINTGRNTILMDAYNANPTSMDVSLRNFIQMTGDNKFAIIGDMLELGNETITEHKKILKLLENSGLEKILLIGKVFSSLDTSSKHTVFTDVSEASLWLKDNDISDYNILIKGSRGIKLEKLLEFL